ncbi:MAG: type II toxin-antitoxin system HicB family antitoxin [Candidatus Altiarchaeota archaeon]
MRYTIVLEKGRESGFVAHCPIMRGCVSQGKTRSEAIKNLTSAMRDYIECLIEDGIPVPQEIDKKFVDVEVSIH